MVVNDILLPFYIRKGLLSECSPAQVRMSAFLVKIC